MNETLIRNWNSCVQPTDEVYHLGDFAFSDAETIFKIIHRLNGKKYLIMGNHDKPIKKDKELQQLFEECTPYLEVDISDHTAKGGNRKLVLCHYAMLVWNKSHHGSFMLHGHSHGNLAYPMKARIMDVGVDPQGYVPITATEVVRKLSAIPPPVFDHHGKQ